MAVNWRALFDSLDIRWSDRTGNSIQRQPVINCPFCEGDDPTYHLNVNDIGYYCLRNRSHSGRNHMRLLRKLLPNRTREELAKLINDFSTPEAEAVYERPIKQPDEIARTWSQFKPAADSRIYTEYLASRGFPDPAAVCRRYDLRYSVVGEWAGRLLIPLNIDDELVAWTGRAIAPFNKLRYKTQSVARQDLVYIPRDIRASVILVEGPIDALKISVATEQLPWSATALLGTSFGPDRIWRVIDTIYAASNVYTSLDPSVGNAYPTQTMTIPVSMTNTPYRELSFWLASALKGAKIRRLRLPPGHEDFGAMHTNEIVALLNDPNKGSANDYNHNLLTYEEAKRLLH